MEILTFTRKQSVENMVRKSGLVALTFTILLLFGCVYGLKEDSSLSEKAPRVRFLEDECDLGKVVQGQDVFHIFRFVNEGSDTLTIGGLSSSCNCTLPIVNAALFGRNDTGLIKVLFRSAGKSGKVTFTITVFSNDKVNPTKNLHLSAEVIRPENVHKGSMNSPERLANIFSGDCAICHVNNGVGRMERELLEADCTICHGAPDHFRPARDLSTVKLLNVTTEEIREIINKGKEGTTMPGFSKEKGGPLTKEQIESLVLLVKPGVNIR
jgi:mono/diheme cytochrome c family protein